MKCPHCGAMLNEVDQDKLSRKIRHLYKSGYPVKQAAAIGYSELGEAHTCEQRGAFGMKVAHVRKVRPR